MDKRTLVEELECSRSTVNRAVRELEALDLIAYTNGGYQTTSLGETVATGFADLAETVELQLKFDPFLRWLPNKEFDLELKHLQDAELLLPKPGDPYAMINRHVSVLSQASDIRCLLPLVGLHAQETAHEQIVRNGACIELIVASDAVERLVSDPEFAGMTEEMAAMGRFHLFRYKEQVPFFVGVFDDVVRIGADEDGEPRAIVETTNPHVRNWAESKVEKYKQRAEPVAITAESAQIGS